MLITRSPSRTVASCVSIAETLGTCSTAIGSITRPSVCASFSQLTLAARSVRRKPPQRPIHQGVVPLFYLLANTLHPQAIQRTVHSMGGFRYLQHVDGTYWDGCWPQPCEQWDFNGYSPASLSDLDGVLAESWVQGSLVGGVKTMMARGAINSSSLLLISDVPNCDAFPRLHPCALGSLEADVTAWFEKLAQTGIANGTYGIWDAVDCGTEDNANYYGDILPNASGLTPKGQLHRVHALAAAHAGAAYMEAHRTRGAV